MHPQKCPQKAIVVGRRREEERKRGREEEERRKRRVKEKSQREESKRRVKEKSQREESKRRVKEMVSECSFNLPSFLESRHLETSKRVAMATQSRVHFVKELKRSFSLLHFFPKCMAL